MYTKLGNNTVTMAIFRRTIRAMAFTGFVLFALSAVGLFFALPREFSRNRTLVKSFDSAASWISHFSNTHGRLPSKSEYEAWTASQPEHFYGVQSIGILASSSQDFYQEAIEAFGPPNTSNGYVLATWMGEGHEYYASWAGKSTVDHSFRFYGCIILFGVFFVAAACGCMYVAYTFRPTGGSNRPA